MAMCLKITVGEDGMVSVAECDPMEKSEEYGEGQQFGSVDEALSSVKSMLGGEDTSANEEAEGFAGVFEKQKMMKDY